MAHVLVTGGAGYVGTHVCVELAAAGHGVLIADNLSTARSAAVLRVRELTGQDIPFFKVDLRDRAALMAILVERSIGAVLHLAGLKAVGDSVAVPLEYFRNNVEGTICLLDAMRECGVRVMVFSSSAAVYSTGAAMPVAEEGELRPASPYGRTKHAIELILRDLAISDPQWKFGMLRYFNPVGAHASGRIGEDSLLAPTNLFPHLANVAAGRQPSVQVYGNDYATPDGTGIRDYVHVSDVAEAHVRAMEWLADRAGCHVWNLGTGRGTSVLEVLRTFERASGRKIPYTIAARRPGDMPQCFADASKAGRELGWTARRTLEDMCADAWKWRMTNPVGYSDTPDIVG